VRIVKEAGMGRHVRTSLALLLSAMTLAAATACSVIPEEKIVKDFFRASRLRDNAALGTFATTSFDPNRQGQVTDFNVLSVSPEHSSPLSLERYDTAFAEATAAHKAFAREKYNFQQANLEAIRRIEKLESSNAPVTRRDANVQATWSKWRDDELRHLKAVSDARVTLGRAKSVAELSLSRPHGPMPDMANLTGSVVDKDITIDAAVKLPDGQTVRKNLVVTASRTVVKNQKGETLTGRWIVTKVREAEAAKTS
jgi:hypothetical protein